ncbi:MAG: heat-inducible transcriptional repressor HrcA [Fusobacteriaceae bacterium]
MNEREKMVLNAIVNYYLTSGEVIGSRALVKKYGIDFSSATIRNVMSDLEDGGYLAKTHTSSGRIPTDQGYRYYLSELLQIEKLTKLERNNIEMAYEKRMSELDAVFEQTSALLSKLTSYAGIVIEPDHTREKIKKIELVHIDDHLIMAVVVMDNRAIRTKKIHLEQKLSRDDTENISREINEKLKNNEFTDKDLKRMFSKTGNYDGLYEAGAVIENEIYQDVEGKLFLNNALGIIDTHGEDATKVMQLLESDKDIKNIFEELVKNKEKNYGVVNVIFGDEINVQGLENYSFVYSRYKVGGSDGIVGVIGPKRMAYSKTMGLVEYVAKEVNKVINKIDEKDDEK